MKNRLSDLYGLEPKNIRLIKYITIRQGWNFSSTRKPQKYSYTRSLLRKIIFFSEGF